jgi:hypothetical protein
METLAQHMSTMVQTLDRMNQRAIDTPRPNESLIGLKDLPTFSGTEEDSINEYLNNFTTVMDLTETPIHRWASYLALKLRGPAAEWLNTLDNTTANELGWERFSQLLRDFFPSNHEARARTALHSFLHINQMPDELYESYATRMRRSARQARISHDDVITVRIVAGLRDDMLKESLTLRPPTSLNDLQELLARKDQIAKTFAQGRFRHSDEETQSQKGKRQKREQRNNFEQPQMQQQQPPARQYQHDNARNQYDKRQQYQPPQQYNQQNPPNQNYQQQRPPNQQYQQPQVQQQQQAPVAQHNYDRPPQGDEQRYRRCPEKKETESSAANSNVSGSVTSNPAIFRRRFEI